MNTPVEEGDYEGLVDVMAKLLGVRGKQMMADTMFEPLMKTVELLEHYQQEIPDTVYQHLQVRVMSVSNQ